MDSIDPETLTLKIENLMSTHESHYKTTLNFLNITSIDSLLQPNSKLSLSEICKNFSAKSKIYKFRKNSKTLLAIIESELAHKNSLISKSKLFYYKSLILMQLGPEAKSEFQKAESCLQKSVKLDPTFVEAWNQLGEAYWSRNELKQSLDCFEHAENHSKSLNAETLRNLGSLLRQIDFSGNGSIQNSKLPVKTNFKNANNNNNTNNTSNLNPSDRADATAKTLQRSAAIEKSFVLTKKALKLDLKCGMNWYMLGNAHMSLGKSEMAQANAAYERAKSLDINCQFNADLNFNQAQIHLYYGRFKEAIRNLKIVRIVEAEEIKSNFDSENTSPTTTNPTPTLPLALLEPNLDKSEGVLKFSNEKLINTIRYLEKISNLINLKGKLKKKVLDNYEKKLVGLASELNEKTNGNVNLGIVVASISDNVKDIIAFTAIVMMLDDSAENNLSDISKLKNKMKTKFIAVRISNLLKGGNILIGDSLKVSNNCKIESLNLTIAELSKIDEFLVISGKKCQVGDKNNYYSENCESLKNAEKLLKNYGTNIDFSFINVVCPEKHLLINERNVGGYMTTGMTIKNSGKG